MQHPKSYYILQGQFVITSTNILHNSIYFKINSTRTLQYTSSELSLCKLLVNVNHQFPKTHQENIENSGEPPTYQNTTHKT